jgi:hypothetical protein
LIKKLSIKADDKAKPFVREGRKAAGLLRRRPSCRRIDFWQFGFFIGVTVQLNIGRVSCFDKIKHKRVLNMVAYEFYRRDERGKNHFIWIMPERRKHP